ncbi:MAG TPA: glycosyltransferase [Candidatus Sumerlaeota bacterium]|nr:glycosyltransferase [Candidatus Sumerlaeota bacterium]
MSQEDSPPAAPAAPRFSVIVPVRNRPADIRRCVEAVHALDFPRKAYELIVVDNGSTDATAREARAAGARVIHEPIVNRCRARNLGALAARAPWLVFLDSDCVPDPDWLAAFDAFLENLSPADRERTAIVAGAVLDVPPANVVEEYIARRGWFDQEKYLRQQERFVRPFALTANLMVRRRVYLALGGLDPGLPYPGEDADFCWRVADAGYRLSYAPEARVTHHHRATLRALWIQSCHWGIGQADLFVKWRSRWRAWFWFKPVLLVWAAKGLLKSPWRWLRGRTPFERREPWLDFLANSAMLWGRFWGGLRRGTLVF